MESNADMDMTRMTGDQLIEMLGALANPHRLRVIAKLSEGSNYVSQLAREIGMSRPLLHMHLKKLEAAGLIEGSLEVSKDGKAMRYYEVTAFDVQLTPETIRAAAATLSEDT